MNTDSKLNPIDAASHETSPQLRGYISRRDGNMRAVMLERKTMKTNQPSGSTGNFRPLLQDAFAPIVSDEAGFKS